MRSHPRPGVSVETVYASFRSKGGLLPAAIDVAVVVDAVPVPLDQRPEFAALGPGTRRQRAQATARLVAGINQRTAGVVLALREAAASDADLAERRREREQRRRINVEQGAALVAGRAVTAEDIDGLWALVAVEIYQMLTELRGWTRSNTKTGWPMSLNGCCPARTSATYPLDG